MKLQPNKSIPNLNEKKFTYMEKLHQMLKLYKILHSE